MWVGPFDGPTVTGTPPPPPPPPSPDFSLSINPASATVNRGQSTTATVSVSSSYGYSSTVSLSASGQPTGATVNFSPPSSTVPFNSTMTIRTSSATPTGTYSMTITASDSDGKVRTAAYTLNVIVDTTPPPAPELISPRDNSFINDNTPTFRWNAVSDNSGVSYEMQHD